MIQYRKKEVLRKQIHHHRLKQELEAGHRKEIGIDF
jgi:hypothetical protein